MNEGDFRPHQIKWTPEKIRRLWDYYSGTRAFDDVYFGHRAGTLFARLLGRRGLLMKANNILDLSCGRGNIIAACSRYMTKGQCIRGVDVSERSIEETTVLNKNNPYFLGATHLDDIGINFSDGSQDLVFSTEVIEHLTDEEISSLLGECRRLLGKGGKLVLTTPNEEILESGTSMCPECGCTYHRWQHRQSWSTLSLSQRVESEGFRVTECRTIVWEPWFVNLYFSFSGRKKPGLYLIAET